MRDDRRVRWHGSRCARLGFLRGIGYTDEQIAADLFIRSTPEAVRRAAQRMEVPFRERTAVELATPEIMQVFEAAATRYNMTGKQLAQTFLRSGASEPDLIHNVCDLGEA